MDRTVGARGRSLRLERTVAENQRGEPRNRIYEEARAPERELALGHHATDQLGGGRGDSARDRHLRLHGRPREEKWRADRLSCRRTRDRAHDYRRYQQERAPPQRR